MAIQTTDNKYGVAKWIVDPVLGRGTHQTIASAIASASSGETIFIRPGTYTENLTLKAGVNLTAFEGDQDIPSVTIIGNATFSTAGNVAISNLRMQTNGAAALTVSGSAASVVNINNCYLNYTNATGLVYSSSNVASKVNFYDCNGDIGTTGIALHTSTGAGMLIYHYCYFLNSGATVTAATSSAGQLFLRYSIFLSPFTTSGTGLFISEYSFIDTSALNVIALTHGGTGGSFSYSSSYGSGTAAAITIGAGAALKMTGDNVNSENLTAVITGAGTLVYSVIHFLGSGFLITTTTVTRKVVDGGEYKGRNVDTAPSAGMIGEHVKATVDAASRVSLVTSVPKTITSIILTAGIWDVTSFGNFVVGSGTTVAQTALAISETTNTLSTQGDNTTTFNTLVTPIANFGPAISVPSYRLTVSVASSPKTIYMVASCQFSAGANTAQCYGRISATRVA